MGSRCHQTRGGVESRLTPFNSMLLRRWFLLSEVQVRHQVIRIDWLALWIAIGEDIEALTVDVQRMAGQEIVLDCILPVDRDPVSLRQVVTVLLGCTGIHSKSNRLSLPNLDQLSLVAVHFERVVDERQGFFN